MRLRASIGFFIQFPSSLIAEEQINGQPWVTPMCGTLTLRPMDLVLAPVVCVGTLVCVAGSASIAIPRNA